MSLGDELRYLRAKAGGITPAEIAEQTGVEANIYTQLEQRYREMGDDETLKKLASFFDCDAELLIHARPRSRKALSQALVQAEDADQPMVFKLRTGESLRGHIDWWDLGAIGLIAEDSGRLIVVQRHAVIDW
jgi:transcriptional regulator with XRE-family HTH domain